MSGLGYIPTVDEEENRDMLSALVGVKMGSGNKASTYNWFKNRLADTQGVIVPRSMIDIFANAARKEIELKKDGKAFCNFLESLLFLHRSAQGKPLRAEEYQKACISVFDVR